MSRIEDISNFYFIGIGGIGMSAIARYLLSQGKTVAGYDKTKNALTQDLESNGIEIIYQDDLNATPIWFQNPDAESLIIYTPAVPFDLKILEHAKANAEPIKRSEALAQITRDKYTIAVAGTHGKTTTTTYLAHLLVSENKNVTAFLGGISTNYQSNYIRHEGVGEEIVVVEADEYDRSFLTLNPNISVITSCEPDHLDIYGTFNDLKQSYNDFANKLSKNGHLILHESLKDIFTLRPDIKTEYFGWESGTIATELKVESGSFHFSVPDLHLDNLQNGMPGAHNIMNALGATIAVSKTGPLEQVHKALSSFKGIKRRFEFIHKGQHVYIDDYAHHPSEIKAAISTARYLYPHKKLTLVFQPHLFSRTRDFADDFKTELGKADDLYLMPIYPAREKPINGIVSDMLLDGKGAVKTHQELLQLFSENTPELLLTLGAGDIDLLVPDFRTLFIKAETND